jgi:trimeric autotransporter adhesin
MHTSRYAFHVLFLVGIGAALCPTAWAGPDAMHPRTIRMTLDSGTHHGRSSQTVIGFQGTARAPGAAWIRLRFEDDRLGKASFLTVTSLKDGGRQRLDARSLRQWANSSAYFNGDAVRIELHVAPQDSGVFFRLGEVTMGPESAQTDCFNGCASGVDSNPGFLSADPAVGRVSLYPNGPAFSWSTAFIASNGALLTSGEYAPKPGSIVEFNVPHSSCKGDPVFSAPRDQYVVDSSTVVFHASPNCDSWCVFGCFPNPETGLTPALAQGAFYRMSKDDTPPNVFVVGYSVDRTPLGCDGCWNDESRVQHTHDPSLYYGHTAGHTYSCDEITYDALVAPGDEGGPVVEQGTTVAIGIHVYDNYCNQYPDPPYDWNVGIGFLNGNLESAIQTFPGPAVTYVDNGSAATIRDGTVFHPFVSVTDGIDHAPVGGIIALVRGTYSTSVPLVLSKRLTLEAPVGPVRIGN